MTHILQFEILYLNKREILLLILKLEIILIIQKDCDLSFQCIQLMGKELISRIKLPILYF